MTKVIKYNIVNPKKYESQGQEKTFWANVGTLTEFHREDGTISRIIEINHLNGQFSVFPVEQEKSRPQQQVSRGGQQIDYPTNNLGDVPF